jgi:hypothetical protein
MEDNNQAPQQPASKVERYTNYALQYLSIGLADDGQPYAYLEGQDNRIAHPLRGKWIKRWLRQAAHANGQILRNDDLDDILENLYAHAAVDDLRLQIYLRVGRNEQGDIEIDLGTQDYERVLLSNGAARVVQQGSNTLFKRPDSMLPLPIPADTGSWTELLPFLNMTEDHQYLIVAVIGYVWTHPKGTAAYPITVIQGQQGDGKSLLGRILRMLLDNNAAGIQRFPRDARDMAISSLSQYLLVYDNIRGLSKDWSDVLCIFATSGSIGTRKLYTDAEESLIQVHAPIVCNGIHNFIEEPDLASRCVTVRLLPLAANDRREETDLARDLTNRLPAIFRGLLDLSASILQLEASAHVIQPERLMTFCRWLAAMEQVLNMPPGRLQKAYSKNIRVSMLETVRENILGSAVLNFIAARPGSHWIGSPTELLSTLGQAVPVHLARRHTDWPQTPISLSKRLKRIAPLLKFQGVEISIGHSTQRQIEITYCPPESPKPIDGTEEPDEVAPGAVPNPGLSACGPTQNNGESIL